MLNISRSKLHYTASGIITPIGGRLVDERHEIKPIVKQHFFVSSCLNTEINILRCTVSKTSKPCSLLDRYQRFGGMIAIVTKETAGFTGTISMWCG